MRNLIDLQKLKIKTEDFSTNFAEEQHNPGPPGIKAVPTIVVEDTNLLGTSHTNFLKPIGTKNKEEKIHNVNLKRQAVVFKKGSERPRIATASHSPLRNSISCQNLTTFPKRTENQTNYESKKHHPVSANQKSISGQVIQSR